MVVLPFEMVVLDAGLPLTCTPVAAITYPGRADVVGHGDGEGLAVVVVAEDESYHFQRLAQTHVVR
jgi:hypothetical protein